LLCEWLDVGCVIAAERRWTTGLRDACSAPTTRATNCRPALAARGTARGATNRGTDESANDVADAGDDRTSGGANAGAHTRTSGAAYSASSDFPGGLTAHWFAFRGLSAILHTGTDERPNDRHETTDRTACGPS